MKYDAAIRRINAGIYCVLMFPAVVVGAAMLAIGYVLRRLRRRGGGDSQIDMRAAA